MTEPYFADDRVTLWHGDWREILPTLDLSADLILADPPYGETSLAWDRWPEGWPALAAQHARSMWCYGSMRMFLDRRDEFADWRLSQDVVWEKHNGSGFHTDRFKRVHEHAVHWYQGPWSEVRHCVPTTPDATARSVHRKQRPPHTGEIADSTYVSVRGGPRLMRSVMFHRSAHGNAINETEKPIPLTMPLIEYACPPDGLVLDLFAGSCNGLAAARMIGRRAIGFEVRESQCEKAAQRLSQGDLLDGILGGTA